MGNVSWHAFHCLSNKYDVSEAAGFDITNSVALVSERTIPTERPPLVGEVSANFCGRRMPRGQRDGYLRLYSQFSRPEPLLFLPSSSSTVLTRLSGPLPDPLLLRKSGSIGNQTRISGSVARKSNHWTTERLLDEGVMLKWILEKCEAFATETISLNSCNILCSTFVSILINGLCYYLFMCRTYAGVGFGCAQLSRFHLSFLKMSWRSAPLSDHRNDDAISDIYIYIFIYQLQLGLCPVAVLDMLETQGDVCLLCSVESFVPEARHYRVDVMLHTSICTLSHIVTPLSLSWFSVCAAWQCLKHSIVFSTLVTL
jgi:hypothetical protein